MQELKAALDEAIASLARRPDLAAALWERLVAAVVVAPASADNPAVPRYDLSYQLNEIEVRAGEGWQRGRCGSKGAAQGAQLPTWDVKRQCFLMLCDLVCHATHHIRVGQTSSSCMLTVPHLQARAEDYSEAIAFVHLLNALWRGGGSGSTAPADDGRSVAHFTKFVRDDLLSTAFQVRCFERTLAPSACWQGKKHVCSLAQDLQRFLKVLQQKTSYQLLALACLLYCTKHCVPCSPLCLPLCSAPTRKRGSAGCWCRLAWSTASCAWSRFAAVRWWTAMRKNAAHSSSQAVHPAAALQQAASDWCSEGVHNPSCACAVAALATDAASTAAVKPPGLDVLLDLLGKLFTFGLSAPAPSLRKANFSAPFLHHASQQCTSLAALTLDWPISAGERNVLRAAMVTTLIEVDRLAFERHSAPFGTWRLQKPAAAWTFRLPELCSMIDAQCLCANSPLGLRMRGFNLFTHARLSSPQVLPRRRRCWPRCACCAALWSRTRSLSSPCSRPRTLVCHRMHLNIKREVAYPVLLSIAPPQELPSRLWHFGLRRYVMLPSLTARHL